MRKERKERKERKSRATKASKAGRKPVSDPRKTSHLMLFRSEREACDAYAEQLGLGFSPWARFVLLGAVAQGQADGKLAPGSVGKTFAVMAKAILLELRDLPAYKRQEVVVQLVAAFEGDNDEAVKQLALNFV